MKKKILPCIVLLLSYIVGNAQLVETLVTHPKIKDGMHVDALGHIYTTSGGLQNGTEIGKYDVFNNTYDFDFQTGFFGPIDIDELANGDFVVTNYDNNTVFTIDIDTGQLSVIASGLDGPAGIAIDENDTIYISNFGAPPTYSGHQIHKITPDGTVSVLADSPLLFRFQALVFNGDGELIVSSQNELYKVDTETGELELWVDLGSFGFGHMIYRSLDSNIYGTATGESKIYKVDSLGVVSVYAGSVPGYQDGILSEALFNTPLGLAISPDENILYVGDSNHLRKITIDITLGNEEAGLDTLIVHPNPTQGIFHLTNKNNLSLATELYDSTGRIIFKMETDDSNISYDMGPYAQGVYYLTIQSGNQKTVKKIVKHK